MIDEQSFTVGEDAVRPARPDGTCFYCRKPLGELHSDGCMMRRRSVVMRFSVDLVISAPVDQDGEALNFRYNEGTWCADNLMAYLDELMQRTNDCLCSHVSAQYIREANENDQEGQAFEFGKE